MIGIYNLALCYELGEGVEIDITKAIELYSRISEKDKEAAERKKQLESKVMHSSREKKKEQLNVVTGVALGLLVLGWRPSLSQNRIAGNIRSLSTMKDLRGDLRRYLRSYNQKTSK